MPHCCRHMLGLEPSEARNGIRCGLSRREAEEALSGSKLTRHPPWFELWMVAPQGGYLPQNPEHRRLLFCVTRCPIHENELPPQHAGFHSVVVLSQRRPLLLGDPLDDEVVNRTIRFHLSGPGPFGGLGEVSKGASLPHHTIGELPPVLKSWPYRDLGLLLG